VRYRQLGAHGTLVSGLTIPADVRRNAAQVLDSHDRLIDPAGRTDPWPGHMAIGQQRCDAARRACDYVHNAIIPGDGGWLGK
jgi:hypothetical protein